MNTITKLYDSIHMPQSLENRILNPPVTHKRRFRPFVAVAVLLTLVCLLGCKPAIQNLLVTSFPDLDLTIFWETADDGTSSVVLVDTDESTFAYVEKGRLYFTGNGENLDITDQITEESPFFYTYEEQGYEIYMVVGYNGTLDNFGTYEFLKENGIWFTGTGRNFLSNIEDGVAYPWVQVVWDTLDIPWPMPSVIIRD